MSERKAQFIGSVAGLFDHFREISLSGGGFANNFHTFHLLHQHSEQHCSTSITDEPSTWNEVGEKGWKWTSRLIVCQGCVTMKAGEGCFEVLRSRLPGNNIESCNFWTRAGTVWWTAGNRAIRGELYRFIPGVCIVGKKNYKVGVGFNLFS